MRTKKIILTNFSRAVCSESLCLRPDTEKELFTYLNTHQPKSILTRGAGLSYSDCCLNKDGLIINTERFNHYLDFDPSSGLVICQGGITFYELLRLHPDFIPPVLPGTVHATLAGGLANDVHGKNNHHAKSFGHWVEWIELFIKDRLIRCSRKEHSSLFYATIGGLGLTGIIIRLALRLKKASHFVQVENESFDSLNQLIERMTHHGISYDYQVAWLDLLNKKPRALLSLAHHIPPFQAKEKAVHAVPALPISLIKKWNMKCFNNYYYHHKKPKEALGLEDFNNPLDRLKHWNRLYGKKGLLQFQAVFPTNSASATIEQLIKIINSSNAIPTLAVVKLFTQPGAGLLSFCMPGITLAVDFNNNQYAQLAIKKMNQFILENKGKIYLAKDLFLTSEQYEAMYEQHAQFSKLIIDYQSPMHSDLGQRLGIMK
ncbi:FAD-binding oxidoreductase [Legionella sp. km772]|uniref:FAD-binding oxidoreductase n=1 Tax=Legionella sp. km772 TaxID=2498111 RepID=UPI000F8D32CC|nr:FAD-binding oxidoreductase [Legionella sp. km772]RUR04872.1 FAD-binding oxidoreductase [Legionella sp. km772]